MIVAKVTLDRRARQPRRRQKGLPGQLWFGARILIGAADHVAMQT